MHLESRNIAETLRRAAVAVERLLCIPRRRRCAGGYAEAEALAIATTHRDVLIALRDALIAKGTLDGAAVDRIIIDAVAAREREAEVHRRAEETDGSVSLRARPPHPVRKPAQMSCARSCDLCGLDLGLFGSRG